MSEKMSKLKQLESKVYKVLLEDPKSRSDDYRLIVQVIKSYDPDIIEYPFTNVMLGHKTLKLPSLESITRCRRKIQENNPWLKDEEVAEFREIQREEHVEYARS